MLTFHPWTPILPLHTPVVGDQYEAVEWVEIVSYHRYSPHSVQQRLSMFRVRYLSIYSAWREAFRSIAHHSHEDGDCLDLSANQAFTSLLHSPVRLTIVPRVFPNNEGFHVNSVEDEDRSDAQQKRSRDDLDLSVVRGVLEIRRYSRWGLQSRVVGE